jgi:hypothetical protein
MRRTVLRERPVIEPHAPENVIVDMAAPWWDVVQEGAFLIVKIPMHVGDVEQVNQEMALKRRTDRELRS